MAFYVIRLQDQVTYLMQPPSSYRSARFPFSTMLPSLPYLSVKHGHSAAPKTGLIHLTLNFVSVHSPGCAFTKPVKSDQKCEEVSETVGLEEQGPMIAMLLILTTNLCIPSNYTALNIATTYILLQLLAFYIRRESI